MCIFCNDEEPEPETPMKFDPMSSLAGIGFAAFVMSIYKPKKHSLDDTGRAAYN